VETEVTHTPLFIVWDEKQSVDFATKSHRNNKYITVPGTDTCTKGHTICNCV